MDQPLPYRPKPPSPDSAPPGPPEPPKGGWRWPEPDPDNEPGHWKRIPREKRLQAAAILVGVILVATFAWLSWALPIGRSLQPLETPAFVFVSADGKPFARKGFVKDEPVRAADLPEHVKQAFISVEDRRFYRHLGVDLRAIARALRANQQAGEVVEGGSTITQQLAKTAFLDSRQTLRRKAQEALIALWLELRLSKDEILSRYLSAVYFGDGVYGLRSAARHYFGKTPEKLTVQEAAMLAGLLKAPSRLAPTNNRKGAVERYRVVLQTMVDTGAITEAQERRYSRNPPRVKGTARDLPSGHWFSDWIAEDAVEAAPRLYGQLYVRTTLDSRLQERAQRILRRTLASQGRARNVTQGAIVAMRPDGRVVALVGGRDYKASSFNRATQARRQPGSAFKMFVWYAALRAGMRPDSRVLDTPLTIGDWSPENYGKDYDGNITLTDALAKSSNVAAVRLATRVGPRRVVQAARDLGVRSPLDPNPVIALGAEEMTLIELTAAYAAVANGSTPVQPWGLLDARPRVRQHPVDHARQLVEMLSAVTERGTGRASGAEFGKTGTTQNNRDAVFVGYVDGLVVGVWLGNDNGRPMRGVTGGGLPAQIFRELTGAEPAPAPVAEPVDPYGEDPYGFYPEEDPNLLPPEEGFPPDGEFPPDLPPFPDDRGPPPYDEPFDPEFGPPPPRPRDLPPPRPRDEPLPPPDFDEPAFDEPLPRIPEDDLAY